ncbi:MAG: histidine phosphatase family protein [Saprospiraceae bacterium]
MADKIIYLLRHGQTEYNVKGIAQGGGVDTSLNETGRQQAFAFYQTYRHLSFDVCITSKLKRTHETVAPFIEAGIPWEQSPHINEMGWGTHEGKVSTEQSRLEFQQVIDAWERGEYHAAMAQGESAAALGERLSLFVDHIRQRQESLLLVCSHGRAMRGLMCLLNDKPLSAMSLYSHANTGVWVIEQRGQSFRVLTANDTSHLLLHEEGSWHSLR